MRRLIAAAAIAVASVLAIGGVAQAKPTVYPTTLTATVKQRPLRGCPLCLLLTGSLHSPKPACVRQRQVYEAVHYADGPYAGETYTDALMRANGQGRLKVILDGSDRLAWIRVYVEPLRLSSGVFCQSVGVTLHPKYHSVASPAPEGQ